MQALLDRTTGILTFVTTKLAPMALVRSRTALLPYKKWSTRPSKGKNGNAVRVVVDCGFSEGQVWKGQGSGGGAGLAALWSARCHRAGGHGLASRAASRPTAHGPLQFEFECTEAGCALVGPSMPLLADLIDLPMEPWLLLLELSRRGLHLMPEDRDAAHSGTGSKDLAVEMAFCSDLALITGAFLLGSSRWNQFQGEGRRGGGARCRPSWEPPSLFAFPHNFRLPLGRSSTGPQECIARVSEIVDWEGGGRTEAQHVERIFAKERQEKPNKARAGRSLGRLFRPMPG